MYSTVPRDIQEKLKGEPVDFVVQSEHDFVKQSIGKIISVILIAFSPLFIIPIVFTIPLLELIFTGTSTITVNGEVQEFTRENPSGPILFSLVPLSILIITIIPFIFSLRKVFKYLRKKGPWYAGTNKYLIEFDDVQIDYYKWSEFEDRISTKVNKNTMDIILHLKKDRSLAQDDKQEIINDFGNVNMVINGKKIDLNDFTKNHNIFMNKIGILGIKNGDLVMNMIKHNMNRFREPLITK